MILQRAKQLGTRRSKLVKEMKYVMCVRKRDEKRLE